MKWRRIRHGVSAFIKSQEEQYTADEHEMLRQGRPNDAMYYKGARNAMKHLGIALKGYHYDT